MKALALLFERDLQQLKQEIGAYNDESLLWEVLDGTSNSAGNLSYHITGNLQHFIGAVLGNTGYVRDRHAEFNATNIPRAVLIEQIETANLAVADVLGSLGSDSLAQTYPIEVFGSPMTTEYFLLHLYGHMHYHLGQINYHRRCFQNNK